MSTARLVRFIIGLILASIFLGILLPIIGIPRSHFLPPPIVYGKADGVAHGFLVDKYYDITGNPFDVGGKQYFLDYQFSAKSPGPKGVPDGGPVQTYYGTMRLADSDKGVYDTVPIKIDKQSADKYVNQQKIPAYPVPLKIKYDKTYPYINGVDDSGTTPWGQRNIGEGSNLNSGWILYIFLTIAVGYGFMMLIERFSNNENI